MVLMLDELTNLQTGFLAIESGNLARVKGVLEEDIPVIDELWRVWRAKYPRNVLRSSYYLAHYEYKGVSYSIPDNMRALAQPMIGWPNKAVRALSDLSVFEGFSTSDSMIQSQIDEISEHNMLDVKASQSIVSAYTHGCAFLTVSNDDEGNPVITPRSADWSAALWDWQHNRLLAALTITNKDKNGYITGFNAWLPYRVYVCTRSTESSVNALWTAEMVPTGYPYPTVVPVVNDEQLNRPLGSSRITRPLMALTDFGLRTLVRMEATAEFYAAPRIWFLGANKDQVSPDTWSSMLQVINGMPANRDGSKPELHQLSQASMTPHSDMLKTIALMVAAETDIPVTDLGITTDNPSSAEAMAEAERKLARTADRQNRRFGRSLKQAMCMALGDISQADMQSIRPLWAPTKETSDAQRADYYTKVASVNSNFANSDVGLTKAGLTWEEIKAQRAYEKEARTQQAVDALRAKLATADEVTNGEANTSDRTE